MNWEDIFFSTAIATIVAATVLGSIWLESAKCSSQADLMALEHSYGPIQGCMVKVNGRWLPLKAIREVNL